MSRFTNSCKLVLISSAWLVMSVPANAAFITLVGDNFNLIYDDAQPSLATYGVPVYGPGTNNILFNQTGFQVSSTDGDGNIEQFGSTVNFDLTRTNSSFNFESLTLFEFGSYTLNGAGASVNLSGSMSVSTPSAGFGPIVDPLPIIGPDGTLTINDGNAHTWTGGAFADLTVPGLQAFGGVPNAWNDENTIRISINNLLEANTVHNVDDDNPLPGTSAFIQKLQSGQAVQIGVNGSPASAVPVPGAA